METAELAMMISSNAMLNGTVTFVLVMRGKIQRTQSLLMILNLRSPFSITPAGLCHGLCNHNYHKKLNYNNVKCENMKHEYISIILFKSFKTQKGHWKNGDIESHPTLPHDCTMSPNARVTLPFEINNFIGPNDCLKLINFLVATLTHFQITTKMDSCCLKLYVNSQNISKMSNNMNTNKY